jgi:hypothetical protein
MKVYLLLPLDILHVWQHVHVVFFADSKASFADPSEACHQQPASFFSENKYQETQSLHAWPSSAEHGTAIPAAHSLPLPWFCLHVEEIPDLVADSKLPSISPYARSEWTEQGYDPVVLFRLFLLGLNGPGSTVWWMPLGQSAVQCALYWDWPNVIPECTAYLYLQPASSLQNRHVNSDLKRCTEDLALCHTPAHADHCAQLSDCVLLFHSVQRLTDDLWWKDKIRKLAKVDLADVRYDRTP